MFGKTRSMMDDLRNIQNELHGLMQLIRKLEQSGAFDKNTEQTIMKSVNGVLSNVAELQSKIQQIRNFIDQNL